MEKRSVTVAAVDVEALEREAEAAVAAVSTRDDLDEIRVRYLGRKSELKLALRDVRDPETGRVLNTLREELERGVAERDGCVSGWLSASKLCQTVSTSRLSTIS